MLKILHAADLHLDSPYTSLPSEKAILRRDEGRQFLSRLRELAIERQVDLVLLAGDLFDSQRVRAETLHAMQSAFSKMPCPVFIAPGNHDFYSPKSPYATVIWPEHVYIFHSETPQFLHLPELNCTVWGNAFTAPHRDTCPITGVEIDPNDPTISLMVTHGDMETMGRYGTISKEAVARSGIDYLALGHVHTHIPPQHIGNTVWAYPGCPEGRGFDELGEKGILYLEISKEEVRSEFIPTSQRRYEIITLDLSDETNAVAAILGAMPRDMTQDICRIILKGEWQGEPLRLDQMQEALEHHFFSLELQDNTTTVRNINARAGEDSLTGIFLQEMNDAIAKEANNEILTLAVRYGLAALENGEEVLP